MLLPVRFGLRMHPIGSLLARSSHIVSRVCDPPPVWWAGYTEAEPQLGEQNGKQAAKPEPRPEETLTGGVA
jgi:hypothetical protein